VNIADQRSIPTAMSDSTDLMLGSPVDSSMKAILEDAILPSIGEFLILRYALSPPKKVT
jgi:hypothetical protein